MSISRLKPTVENTIFSFELNCSCLHGVNAFHLDYQNSTYRQERLYRLIRDTIPYFALTPDEFEELTLDGNLPEINRLAWSRISTAHASKKGDYGELLLFLILALSFPTEIPRFVTKVRLRSSLGDQIKGFDCAHFTVDADDKVSLWLGEAKFHQSFSTAVGSAFDSLNEHIEYGYLEKEISILASNIEINRSNPIRAKLESILSTGRSIDKIDFVIPVLLTYDSKCVKDNTEISDIFSKQLTDELISHVSTISGKTISLRPNIKLEFILFPLHTVKDIKDQIAKLEDASR